MRIVSFSLGEHRSVHAPAHHLDPAGVTVLFGPNGVGKTNILESIALLIDYLKQEELLKNLVRRERFRRKDEADDAWEYLGYAVVAFDEWDDEGSHDHFALHAFLLHDAIGQLLLEYETWENVKDSTLTERDRLEAREVSAARPAARKAIRVG
jgi:hypothetical protein